MTATSVRIMKEFRLLVWPWLAVTSAALLTMAFRAEKLDWGPVNAESLIALGFFAGMPLLAGLGLGSEFQYRTLGLNLAQPVERGEIWSSKVLAGIIAISLPALLFCVSAGSELGENSWMPIFYIGIFTATAFPMTLIARSTIGGAALGALANCPVFWGSFWLVQYLRGHERLTPASMAVIGTVLLGYCVGMVWLGRTLFLRYQAAEGMQSAEAALPGVGFIPEALTAWLRCRPQSPLLNLVRRELRLLRLVWPLTFLSVAAWTALIAFHIVPIDDKHIERMPYLAITVMISVLIALLCGSLSLGEEKSWGTHDWQLTLPVSTSLQWFVKLSVGICLSVFCGALVPMAVIYAAHGLTGNVSYILPPVFARLWPADMAAITILAFWAAGMVKGTAKAAMLVFPACVVTLAGAPLGEMVMNALVDSCPQMFDGLISSIGPMRVFPFASWMMNTTSNPERLMEIGAVLFVGILLLQGLRLFPASAEGSTRSIVRRLSVLFLVSLTAGMLITASEEFGWIAWQRSHYALRELNATLERARVLHPQSDSFQMDSQQLTAGVPLSPEMRRYLSGSSVLMTAQDVPLAFTGDWMFVGGGGTHWTENSLPYSAVLRTATGGTCILEFHQFPHSEHVPNKVVPYGGNLNRYGGYLIHCD